MPLPVEVSWGTTQVQFRAVVPAVEGELVGCLASRPQMQLPGPIAERSLPDPPLPIFDGDYLIRLGQGRCHFHWQRCSVPGPRNLYSSQHWREQPSELVWHRHSCLCSMGIVMNAGTDRSVCATYF